MIWLLKFEIICQESPWILMKSKHDLSDKIWILLSVVSNFLLANYFSANSSDQVMSIKKITNKEILYSKQ